MKLLLFALLILPLCVFAQKARPITEKGITNKIYRFRKFPSKLTGRRNVDVWLPADYSAKKKYNVLYMHDGQNLFNPKESFGGVDWGIDETLQRLINEGKVSDTIVVGIWNSPDRLKEFSPEKAFSLANAKRDKSKGYIFPPGTGANNYLKFVVTELKPFIDKTYSTFRDRDHTFIMGSSMGGVMSLYAIGEYPEIFGGAACVSTHFSLGDGVMLDYMEKFLPSPKNHKIYFDYGTDGLDAEYEPYQIRADKLMQKNGFVKDKNWMTLKFKGEAHNEISWSKRVATPLTFLLQK